MKVVMQIPKVFISYSHDNLAHKQRVLDLATRLRNNGIDSILDQWDLKPGDDLPRFMESNLQIADYVLMICSDNYVNKANSGSGGVGYEKMIITSEYLRNIDSNKVIPIIRQEGTNDVPIFLKTKLYIDFSIDDEFEFSYDELARTLHKSPLFQKPEIGNNPFKPIESSRPNRNDDSLLVLMEYLIKDFESHSRDSIYYNQVVQGIPISRVYLDLIINEAINKGLISKDYYGDLEFTDKGKMFAIQHKLVTGI